MAPAVHRWCVYSGGCLNKVLVSSFLLVFILGCNSYKPKPLAEAGNLGAPTFANIQSQIIEPYCITCHRGAGAGNVNLEGYANVKKFLTAIHTDVVSKHSMPPGQPLPQYLQDFLTTWVSSGAPESGGAPTGPGPTGPVVELTPTFKSISQNILAPKCEACHGTDSDSPVTNYTFLKAKWVVPGNLKKSVLYQQVAKSLMPPSDPLTKKEIQAISDWILQGAQLN